MYSFTHKTLYRVIILILLLAPVSTEAANLLINPASGSFEVGDRVTVRVIVSSNTSINTVSGTVSFPTSLFTIESVSKSGSILNFWVSEPNFSQGAGTLNFEGVNLGGFNGGQGTVVTASLRAIKSGSGTVSFISGQILANDGQGTDVTDNKIGATYSVTPSQAPTPTPTPVAEPEVVVEESQPRPSLTSPEIVFIRRFGNPIISGDSRYAFAQVLLTFESSEGVRIFTTGETDNQGNFEMIVPKTLKRGKYEVHAVVIRSDLSNSYTSNEITISVGNIISDLGWGFFSLFVILFLVLIGMIIMGHQYLRRNKDLKKYVKKESQEAEKVVHKSFDLLRDDAGSDREIKHDLNEAEDIITKEIKDIER